MNKRLLITCTLCAVLSYLALSKSIYYTEKTINSIISFALYAIMNNPAFGHLVNPLVIPSFPKVPFFQLKKLVVTGLTTVRSGNDSRITFDGNAINVYLDVQTDRIQVDLFYKFEAFFMKDEGVVGVILDSIRIDTMFSIPTNYTGRASVGYLRFTRLENFHLAGHLEALSNILNSNFFKNTILDTASSFGVSMANGFLKNFSMPWQNEKLKAKFKNGIKDTGFLLAKK